MPNRETELSVLRKEVAELRERLEWAINSLGKADAHAIERANRAQDTAALALEKAKESEQRLNQQEAAARVTAEDWAKAVAACPGADENEGGAGIGVFAARMLDGQIDRRAQALGFVFCHDLAVHLWAQDALQQQRSKAVALGLSNPWAPAFNPAKR